MAICSLSQSRASQKTGKQKSTLVVYEELGFLSKFFFSENDIKQ